MSSTTPLALLSNGHAMAWKDVPEWPAPEFVRRVTAELDRGARLCAWFAVPERGVVATSTAGAEPARLVAVLSFDADATLAVGRSTPFVGAYPSLTAWHAQAHLFERAVFEDARLRPHGHPRLTPVRAGAGGAPVAPAFTRVTGSQIHEVAVGPVHAGIIEPGHFRFQCAGEDVVQLEIALGYQHRGIERALVGGPHRATNAQMETIAGDTTIAHATAHASAVEALSGGAAPMRAQWVRAIALELERLANHTGDLGALANDVAFQPTAAACGKLRGDFLNMTALLCGNRFGRGIVRPGGSGHDLDVERAALVAERLEDMWKEVEQAIGWLWDAASVRSRFENTGTVTAQQASEIGLVGPAARACGLLRDVRYDQPAGWYRFASVPIAVWPGGDVFARARVRSLEIQGSVRFLREQLGAAVDGPIHAALASPAPDALAVSLVEGWRGEVCHVAITDHDGRFLRYAIVDSSFHNWTGLELAMRDTAISDFPLCNKSFNLSYCGVDL